MPGSPGRLTRQRCESRIGHVTSEPVLHWDDARSWRGEQGHIAGTWHSLAGRASRNVGVKRIQIDPGMWSTPLHLEGQDEEIFYVLGGSGLSVQWEGEGALTSSCRRTRCARATASSTSRSRTHTRSRPDRRARRARLRAPLARRRRHVAPARGRGLARRDLGARRRGRGPPVEAGGGRGPPQVGEPAPRPASIVNADDVEASERDGATVGRRVRNLGRAAGSQRSGMRLSKSSRASSARRPTATASRRRSSSCSRGRASSCSGRREASRSTPCAGARSCAGRRVRACPTRSGAAMTASPSSCTGRARRATSVTTRARGRSTSSALELVARVGEPLDYWDGED